MNDVNIMMPAEKRGRAWTDGCTAAYANAKRWSSDASMFDA